MTAVGLVFSNIHDSNVAELTRDRTMASIPFGGRYRLVDFVLSNIVNAGIDTVGVIAKTNYQSLMKHLGRGKDWDLDRKQGGLIILPPFGEKESESLYNNRLEALQGVMAFIDSCEKDYVIMADCDVICNMDYAALLAYHEESGADITGAYQATDFKRPLLRRSNVFEVDESGRVVDFATYGSLEGKQNFALNTWVFNRELLKNIVHDSLARGMKSLSRDVLAPNLDKIKLMAYAYPGYFSCIDSIPSYLDANLEILKRPIRDELFNKENFPIYTRIKDSAPTKYGQTAKTTNSTIADGCVIEGTVENSVLFRGVKVCKGATVRNSVVMQNGIIGENAVLNYVVTDKSVVVRDGRVLSGCDTHPFYIQKNFML